MLPSTKNWSVNKNPEYTSYKWVIISVAIICMIFAYIARQSYGIIYSDLLLDAPATQVTWIFNLSQFLSDGLSLFGGPLCNTFGQRPILFSGGLLLAASFILSAFATAPETLFYTYGLMSGTGMGLIIHVSSLKVPEYFLNQQGLATSLLYTGSSVGQLIGPMLVVGLQTLCGQFWTILILGVFFLNACPLAVLFHEPKYHLANRKHPEEGSIYTISYQPKTDEKSISTTNIASKPEPKCVEAEQQIKPAKKDSRNSIAQMMSVAVAKCTASLKDVLKSFRMLKSPTVMIFIISISFISIAYANFLMYIPFAMVNDGHSIEDGSLSLTVASSSMVFGRLVIPAIYDHVAISSSLVFMFGSLAMSASILGFTYLKNWMASYACLFLFGISVGCTSSFRTLISLELVGLEQLSMIYGLNGIITSLFYVVGGAGLGFLGEALDDYYMLMRVLSVLTMISFSMWLFMPLAKKYDSKRDILRNQA